MCNYPIVTDVTPEQRLTSIIRESLGVEVDKYALRLFIEAKWHKIAPLAHMIHDEESARKDRCS